MMMMIMMMPKLNRIKTFYRDNHIAIISSIAIWNCKLLYIDTNVVNDT